MVVISDENPYRYRPYVTYAIIGLNAFCWFFIQHYGSAGELHQSICNFGLISGEIMGLVGPVELSMDGYICRIDGIIHPHTLLSHMFMHGSWIHILLNMLMLWVLGDNIEAVLGRIRFIVFYFFCGFVAALFQISSDPSSVAPMVGASGAISGVIGAYFLLFPRNRLTFLLIVIPITAPAWVILGGWFVLQLYLVVSGSSPEIALWAHIGGFICGLLVITLLKKRIQSNNNRHFFNEHE